MSSIVGYFTTLVVERFDGRRWNLPSRIYSDLPAARRGRGDARRARREARPALLPGATGRPCGPGTSTREKDGIEVFTRGFRYPGRTFPGFRVRVDFGGPRAVDRGRGRASPCPALVLEPELLGSVFGAELEDRTVVRLADVPRALTDAILATEDRDFYRHAGVSVRRLFGAVFSRR